MRQILSSPHQLYNKVSNKNPFFETSHKPPTDAMLNTLKYVWEKIALKCSEKARVPRYKVQIRIFFIKVW